jgi:hypothetical protein
MALLLSFIRWVIAVACSTAAADTSEDVVAIAGAATVGLGLVLEMMSHNSA